MTVPARVAEVVEQLVGDSNTANTSIATDERLTVWLDWSRRSVARALLDEDPSKVTFDSLQIAHLWVDDFQVAIRMDVPALQYARAAALVILAQDADPDFVPRSGMLAHDQVHRQARDLLKPLRFAEELTVEPVADTLAHLICTATGVASNRPANFDAVTVTASSKRDLIATARALHRDDPAPVRVMRPPAEAGRGPTR